MNNTIKADVSYYVNKNPDYIKIDTTLNSGIDGIHKQLSSRIVQMEDAAIKEALKKLGWVSPEEHAELLKRHDEALNWAWNDGYAFGEAGR